MSFCNEMLADGPVDGVLLDGRIFNATALAVTLGGEPGDERRLLLHAYGKWGVDFPKYLEGEFAFALWDSRARRLLLDEMYRDSGLCSIRCGAERFALPGRPQSIGVAGRADRAKRGSHSPLARTDPGPDQQHFL